MAEKGNIALIHLCGCGKEASEAAAVEAVTVAHIDTVSAESYTLICGVHSPVVVAPNIEKRHFGENHSCVLVFVLPVA